MHGRPVVIVSSTCGNSAFNRFCMQKLQSVVCSSSQRPHCVLLAASSVYRLRRYSLAARTYFTWQSICLSNAFSTLPKLCVTTNEVSNIDTVTSNAASYTCMCIVRVSLWSNALRSRSNWIAKKYCSMPIGKFHRTIHLLYDNLVTYSRYIGR